MPIKNGLISFPLDRHEIEQAADALALALALSAPLDDEDRYREAFRGLAAFEAAIAKTRQELVDEARSKRFTLDRIGSWMGLSRQALFNRFGGYESE